MATTEDKVKAEGLVRCGKCGNPAPKKAALCVDCEVIIERLRRRKNIAGGLCRCGKPLVTARHCEGCWFEQKAQKVGGRVKGSQLKALMAQQGFKCPYSGRRLTLGPKIDLDHKTPRSRGGTNDIENLQWVLAVVNRMKTDFTHEEFIGACGDIAKRWQNKQNQSPTVSATRLIRRSVGLPKRRGA